MRKLHIFLKEGFLGILGVNQINTYLYCFIVELCFAGIISNSAACLIQPLFWFLFAKAYLTFRLSHPRGNDISLNHRHNFTTAFRETK